MNSERVAEMPIRNSMYLARLATLVEFYLEEESKDKEFLAKKYKEFINYYESGVHKLTEGASNE